MSLEETAANVFRAMESPGSTVPHEPVKSEIVALFGEVDAALDTAIGVVNTGRVEFATWAELSATTGDAGQAGAVYPSDTGTHTPPGGGAAVNNSGVFRYSVSGPTGWVRIGDYRALEQASQAEVDAGTNTAKAVSPATLRAAKTNRLTFVEIEYVSGPANNMVWRVMNPQTLLTGDGTQYRLSGVMPMDSLSSTSIAVTQYDGTPFLPATSVRMPDGLTQTPTGGLKQGDRFTILRNHVPLATYELGIQGLFRLLAQPGYGTSEILPTAHAIDTFGLPVSIDRPVSLRQTGDNTFVIDQKLLWPDHYDGDVGYSHSDIFRATMFDMRAFQSNVSGGALCLNSFFARVGFTDVPFTNLQFTRLVTGNTTDVGQVPSTFEPPFFVLDNADAVGTAVAAGIGHGYMEETACSIIGTLEGVATANLYGGDAMLTFNGDKVVSEVTGYITTSAGEIVASLIYTTTYEPTADSHVEIEVFYDFGTTAAEVVPATTGAGSYAFPVPIQNCDRIVGFLNGVRVTGVGSSVNGIHVIDLKDTTITNLGIIDQAVAWNSEKPEIQVVITNLIGAGKSVEIDGVPQTASYTSGVQNNAWGAKLLGTPVYELGATKLDISGKTYRFNYGIKVERAEPIT